eukprot:6214418-Pleurochrysis_carterae.AAC.2
MVSIIRGTQHHINIAANWMCPIEPQGVTHIPLQQPLGLLRYLARLSYLGPTYILSFEIDNANGYIAIS